MVVGQSSVTMFRYSLDTSKTDQTLVQKSEASSRRGQLELMRLHRREAEAETFRPPLLTIFFLFLLSRLPHLPHLPLVQHLSLFHRTTYPSCCTTLSASGKRRTCPDASALVTIPRDLVVRYGILLPFHCRMANLTVPWRFQFHSSRPKSTTSHLSCNPTEDVELPLTPRSQADGGHWHVMQPTEEAATPDACNR